MTFARPWIPILLAGCVWTEVAMAQTGFGSGSGTTGSGGTTGTTGTGITTGSGTTRQGTSSANQAATEGTTDGTDTTGSGTTGSGKTGTGSGTGTGTGTRPGQTPTSPPLFPGTGTQTPADPFGFGSPPTPSGPTSPFGPARTPGATTTFGLEPRNAAPATKTETTESSTTTGPQAPKTEAPSYSAPTFYGKPQQILTPGEGRFARPKYRYSVSLGMGFDDNTQQTPDREDIEDQVVRQVIPAQPEVAVFQTEQEFIGVKNIGGAFRPQFRTVQRKIVVRPAVPEQVIETPIPGFDFGERNASVVSRLDGQLQVQSANARELFTLDLRAGAEYYWSRDTDPLEFNGSLGATYVRKIGPRMQFTANAGVSYQSQPDYSQINVVDAPGSSGSYLSGNVKLDLTYRWAARFSTVTSLTGNTLMYEGTRSASNFYEIGLGNEFRYVSSPHLTWVLETRYSQLNYLETVDSAINTLFLLVGSDWTMSRRFRSTIRVGEAVRTFAAGGSVASSPYAEVGIIYQPNRRDQLSLNGRYGFEQSGNAQDESLVARISAAYTRTFNPRLQGSLSGNYVNSSTTSGNVESSQTVYDASLYLRYMFTRKFSMNARYSYTLSKTSTGFNDYDRSRFFLTGEYEF